MKTINKIFRLLLLMIVLVSFSQCSSAQKLQKEAPTAFGEVYFQSWVAGVKGGGAGLNIFIETQTDKIILDSVYFRGEVSKLEVKPANKLRYIGRFISESNKKQNPLTEATNTEDLDTNLKMPFDLKDDECVVSYNLNGITKYFKLSNVREKQGLALPMVTRPKNNK